MLAFRPVLARVAAALFLFSSMGWTGQGVALADLDGIDPAEVCGIDVVFLGARGSGQPYNPAAASDHGMGPQVGALYDGMVATQPVGRTLVAVAADDDYPAVDVGIGVVAGEYEGSVALGADEIVSSLRQLEECESAVGGYVLAGYSQGADVMRRAIQRLDPAELDRVYAVVLLADPWFHPYLDPGVLLIGDSHESGCASEDACSQYGILNRFSSDRPALPAPVQLRTMSLCIEGDIVCDYPQASLDPEVHVSGYQPVAGDIGPLVWDVIATRGGGRFVDVGGSVFVGDIEKVAAAGVSRGCNPPVNDRYCPDDFVTRGQMAAFLSRALGYPAVEFSGRFVDVGGSVFVGDIEKVAAAGVSRGCNPPVNDRYCPDDFVTRGQMAAFLSRALGYPAVEFSGRFVDVGGSVFVGDIEKVAAAGVSRGCNPPVNDRYCPDDFVTRGQMAAFLSRALEL